jgi:hypothetical protein
MLLALPAAGLAQGEVTVTLTPPKAAKPTRLALKATGEAVNSGQEAPKSVSLFIARGFKFDSRARAKRCRAADAAAYSCPVASRVATGSADGEATVPIFGTVPFTATIAAFLTPRQQRGDIAGIVIQAQEARSGRRASFRGRLLPVAGSDQFGTELRFENFDFGQQTAPPGASAKLTSFTLGVSARRKVRKRVGHRRRLRVRRYYLIRNPRRCTGSWPYQLRAAFPTRAEFVRDGSVACQR